MAVPWTQSSRRACLRLATRSPPAGRQLRLPQCAPPPSHAVGGSLATGSRWGVCRCVCDSHGASARRWGHGAPGGPVGPQRAMPLRALDTGSPWGLGPGRRAALSGPRLGQHLEWHCPGGGPLRLESPNLVCAHATLCAFQSAHGHLLVRQQYRTNRTPRTCDATCCPPSMTRIPPSRMRRAPHTRP
jgi:hypothetical protein